MRAITICVDYWDYLSICFPYNKHHFDDVLVVTSPQDIGTQNLCHNLKIPYFVTDAFYRNGAIFNKWLALEEGLDYFGRHGWITILDADIIMPKTIHLDPRPTDCLFAPRRYIGTKLLPENEWGALPLWKNEEFSGYFQMFNAACPFLPKPPWHQTNWVHAGGADTFFQALWPDEKKIRLPFNVLHIGPTGKNWCGRVTSLNGLVPDEAPQRIAKMRQLMQERRNNPDPNYKNEKI